MAEIINIFEEYEGLTKQLLEANSSITNLLWINDYYGAMDLVTGIYKENSLLINQAVRVKKKIVNKRKELRKNIKKDFEQKLDYEDITDAELKRRINKQRDKQFAVYLSEIPSNEHSLLAIAPICQKTLKHYRLLKNLEDIKQELPFEEQENTRIPDNINGYRINLLTRSHNQSEIRGYSSTSKKLNIIQFIDNLEKEFNAQKSLVEELSNQGYPVWYRLFSKSGLFELIVYSKRRFKLNIIATDERHQEFLLSRFTRLFEECTKV